MRRAHLEDLLVFSQDLLRLCKVSIEMVGCCETDPILAEIGTQSEEGVTRFYQMVIESELCLQVSSVAENIEVVLGCRVMEISHSTHLSTQTGQGRDKLGKRVYLNSNSLPCLSSGVTRTLLHGCMVHGTRREAVRQLVARGTRMRYTPCRTVRLACRT